MRLSGFQKNVEKPICMAKSDKPVAVGFAPVIGAGCKLLILGSLPGLPSIRAGQYYANQRNSFWQIQSQIFGFDLTGSYHVRCQALIQHGIGLWDVLHSSVRPGSLDARIDTETAIANDFSSLFQRYEQISTVGFNGRKARALFDRLVVPHLSETDGVRLLDLPSTSPAYAAMRIDEKVEKWCQIEEFVAI